MKKLFAAAFFAVMVAVSGVSATPNPDEVRLINRFGHVGLWNTHSAHTLGYGRLALNIYANQALDRENFIRNVYLWNHNPAFGMSTLWFDENGEWQENHGRNYRKNAFNFSLAYGLTHFLDLAVMVPLYIDWMRNYKFSLMHLPSDRSALYDFNNITSGTVAGIGDMEISMKFQYPPYPHRPFFRMAYYGAIAVPTGDQQQAWFPRQTRYLDSRADLHASFGQQGREFVYDLDFANMMGANYFQTSNSPEIDMKMLWTWDFRHLADNFPVLFHFNYGLRWMTQKNNDHIFYLNTGLEVRPAEWLSIFADFSAEPRFSSIQQQESYMLYRDPNAAGNSSGRVFAHEIQRNLLNDPMRISPGVGIMTPIGVTVTAGVDISLANDHGVFFGNVPTALADAARERDANGNLVSPARLTGWQQDVVFETGVEPKVSFAASLGWNGLTVQRPAPVPVREPEPMIDTIRIRTIDTVFVDRFITDTIKVEVDRAPAPVRTHTITSSVVAGQGTINPMGVRTVNDGALAQYTFIPATGFEIEQVTVNGINQGSLAQFSIASVRENYVITVSFREIPRPVVVEVAPVVPVAVEIPREGLILRGVNFQTGSARLTPASFEILDGVIRSLRDWPEVMLEIQGHTDNTGSRNTNMRLSKQRAESVMNYFIQNGVPANRLRAVGFGPDVPIADNATPAGRELNRRVELRRYD